LPGLAEGSRNATYVERNTIKKSVQLKILLINTSVSIAKATIEVTL